MIMMMIMIPSARICLAASLLALINGGLALPAPYQHQQCIFPRPKINGADTKGAVASESDTCSKIGVTIIAQGGSAADAMVATTLCVGVVGMYHSGIGGGGFMLVRDELGRYESIDYRETAPAAATQNMYQNTTTGSTKGGLAVGVPGELRGLEYLHKKYGRLPWKKVVMPSVRVARKGFRVNEDLVRYMKSATASDNFLVNDPLWAVDFAPNGTLLQLGDNITRKRYADTLEKIANQGVEIFYSGEIAKSIIATTKNSSGILTLSDLSSYSINLQPPLSIKFGPFNVFATPAPSSGAITLSILQTLSQFPSSPLKETTAHRLTEAMKFAYGARSNLGDPKFIPNLTSYQSLLLSPEYTTSVRNQILDNSTLPLSTYNPSSLFTPQTAGTSHIVTSDSSGMTVSSTTTINLLFGSKLITPDTGIILNNEMDDFSQPGKRNAFGYEPSPNNFIMPGKRPLSSITPLIVEHASNLSLYFATGAAGGSRIISSTMQTAWHILSGETSKIVQAVKAPRLHHQLMPDVLNVEEGYDSGVYDSLRAKGHNVSWIAPGQSAVQGLMRLWNGTFEAAGETRQLNSGGFAV
ncbi:gamma-glutamyltranspeptidase [Podospora fimiseda]|uniref:Glutathione hydrolase n=1 Tax=Podospora fimiseda TaxID=252190 RepID=A0AAN7H3U7_9PEZI|nr:gamma-glutamyltranspeptidase [Podospora fimiseda]